MSLLTLNLVTVTLCYRVYGLSQYLLNRLRSIQNTAARIVTLSKRFDSITHVQASFATAKLSY